MFWKKEFITLSCFLLLQVLGYDASRSDNLAVYYGQNSIGAANSNKNVWQKPLSAYCQDDVINVFPLAFLNVFFSAGGQPEINLANTCSAFDAVFPGTNLANCQHMASDIKVCQAKGKLVTISLGGATGAAGFTSGAQAQTFAKTVWNLFLGGSSSTRPFGNAVLDGIDLDIEGGSGAHFDIFVKTIRSLAGGSSKKYHFTAAPQCPFPDAYLGSVISAVAFDAIYVQMFSQVYNNFCGIQNFDNPNAWNFGQWDQWAKTTSPNKNVKIFIGAPVSPSAAGSGYVDAATFRNGRYDVAIKNALTNGHSPPATPPPKNPPPKDPPPKNPPPKNPPPKDPPPKNPPPKDPPPKDPPPKNPPPKDPPPKDPPPKDPPPTPNPPGSCTGAAAWSSTTAYTAGTLVSYNGHLWSNKWWSYHDVPGGSSGVWLDKGACKAARELSVVTDAGKNLTFIAHKNKKRRLEKQIW